MATLIPVLTFIAVLTGGVSLTLIVCGLIGLIVHGR